MQAINEKALSYYNYMVSSGTRTDPWVVWAGTMRTPGGSDVTVTGDFPIWLGRTVTIDVPVVGWGAATFNIAVKETTKQKQI